MKQMLWIIFILFMTLRCSFSQSLPPDLREPNNYEEFYYKIAIENNVADICGKISPKAYSKVGFAQAGFQISYQRSQCYYIVAEQTMDDSLCDNIKSLGVITTSLGALDGSKYSKQGCVDNVAKYKKIHRTHLPDGVALSNDLLIPIFSEMGIQKIQCPPSIKGKFIIRMKLFIMTLERY